MADSRTSWRCRRRASSREVRSSISTPARLARILSASGKVEAVAAHDEAEDVAALAAAEAVPALAAGRDDEARRLLAVERAEALVGGPRLLERDRLPDDVEDGQLALHFGCDADGQTWFSCGTGVRIGCCVAGARGGPCRFPGYPVRPDPTAPAGIRRRTCVRACQVLTRRFRGIVRPRRAACQPICQYWAGVFGLNPPYRRLRIGWRMHAAVADRQNRHPAPTLSFSGSPSTTLAAARSACSSSAGSPTESDTRSAVASSSLTRPWRRRAVRGCDARLPDEPLRAERPHQDDSLFAAGFIAGRGPALRAAARPRSRMLLEHVPAGRDVPGGCPAVERSARSQPASTRACQRLPSRSQPGSGGATRRFGAEPELGARAQPP